MRNMSPLIFALILGLQACGINPGTDSDLKIVDNSLSDRIHDDLVSALRADFGDDEGKVWADSSVQLSSDWMIQSPVGLWGIKASELPTNLDCNPLDARCDSDFSRLSCESQDDCSGLTSCESVSATVKAPGQEAKKLCISHADRVWNRIYSTMVEADHELDFVALALPTGRFRTAIVNALAFLSHKNEIPRVRMLFSGANPALPNLLVSPDKALKGFIDDVAKISPYAQKIPINLAWLSVGRLSWNHSKIIVADGDRAISGGHNLWDDDYLTATPVFDLSMEFRGPGANATRDFVNELWTHVENDKLSFNSAARGRFAAFTETWKTSGSTKAISLGRLGKLGSNPSDFALGQMISLAKSSVYINQQDLYNQAVTPLTRTFVFENIIDAAARGTQFRIVQSNNYPFIGGFGSTDGKKAYEAIIDSLTRRLRIQHGLSASVARTKACSTIQYAPFRFSSGIDKWPSNKGTIGTHAKVVILDEAAYYIGSHNLYPANLQEHGMIVTDAKAAAELVSGYWNKVWKESSPGRYACPG